jgi:predicted DNA-binding transcriptional regulator AlpA
MSALQTVAEFCDDHRISTATFYRLMRRGDGPPVIKLGKATRISAEAAAEWRRRMERETSPGGGLLST